MTRFTYSARLCLSFLLAMSAMSASAATLNVNCSGKGALSSIGGALKVLQSAGNPDSSTINVSGVCRENIRIQGLDRLTLNGLNGAEIIDASNQKADTIIITQSQGVLVQGFHVRGGYDAFDIYGLASVRLVNITVDGAFYDGVGVYRNASVSIVNATLQNNGYAGVLAVGSDVTVTGGTMQSNYEGIAIDGDARVYVRISDPFYDGGTTSLPATIAGSQDWGVLVTRGSFQCASCSITGNTSGGVLSDIGSTVKLSAYSSATILSAPGTAVTGNTNNGVVVGALASVTFVPGTSVSGNGGAFQIACNTPTSVTRGAAATGASTNCSDY